MEAVPTLNNKTIARFWSKVDKAGPEWGGSSCWVWRGERSPGGYGRFWTAQRHIAAHRFSLFVAGISPRLGMHVDHLCKNRLCVNPLHLEEVTARENLMRSDTACKLNLLKTHCSRGHEFSGTNLVIKDGGRRRCALCMKMNSQEAYLKEVSDPLLYELRKARHRESGKRYYAKVVRLREESSVKSGD